VRQARAQVRVELLDDSARGVRVFLDEAVDVRERVEQKVRLDLCLEQR
jgi:hypothetical protein